VPTTLAQVTGSGAFVVPLEQGPDAPDARQIGSGARVISSAS
jgi:hypothetical protein